MTRSSVVTGMGGRDASQVFMAYLPGHLNDYTLTLVYKKKQLGDINKRKEAGIIRTAKPTLSSPGTIT
jgi:hypothetical protein